MWIAVPKERSEGERRVALVPDSVKKLASDEHEVVVQPGAGGDYYPDESYAKAGARIADEDDTAGTDVVVWDRRRGQGRGAERRRGRGAARGLPDHLLSRPFSRRRGARGACSTQGSPRSR